MSLADYVQIVRRHAALLLAVIVVGIVVAGITTAATTPLYKATTKVYLAVHLGGTGNDLTLGTTYAEQVAASYADIATTAYVLDPVIEQLGLHSSAASLARRVDVSVVDGELVMTVTASDPSASRAAAIANAVASRLGTAAAALAKGSDTNEVPVSVTRLATAVPPTSPATPILLLNLLIGLIAGLATGVAAIGVREALDTRVRSIHDIERSVDLPVLGRLWRAPGEGTDVLVTVAAPRDAHAEAFRALRANLQFASVGRELRTVVVTSAVAGEGKTTTVVNLAVALAQAGRRVLVVDADLRRPRIARTLGLEGALGLTDALVGRAPLADVIQRWDAGGFDVITAGSVPPNPGELLQSEPMAELVTALRQQYDIVLIDSPPVLAAADAATLSGRADGVLLMAGVSRVRRPQVAGALAQLRAVGAPVVGLVANLIPARGSEAGAYRVYAYDPDPAELDLAQATPQPLRPAPVATGTAAPSASPGEPATEDAPAVPRVAQRRRPVRAVQPDPVTGTDHGGEVPDRPSVPPRSRARTKRAPATTPVETEPPASSARPRSTEPVAETVPTDASASAARDVAEDRS